MKPFLSVLLTALLVTLGCQKDSPTGSTPTLQDQWTFGESREYAISSGQAFEITDPLSGCRFHFPNGGNGKLRILSVTNAPKIEIESGEPFYVDWQGSGTI